MARPSIEAVKRAQTHRWMAIPGVVGTAIGRCESAPCIKVLVMKATPELRKQIPSSVEGYRVVLEETGTIRAIDST
ncbi:MAG TPA: hypothetical protein VFW98_14620 [Gemmatimonadaceae bacterium]|nr:hypothetical protein [Gemmatimonadaceae bacterium]